MPIVYFRALTATELTLIMITGNWRILNRMQAHADCTPGLSKFITEKIFDYLPLQEFTRVDMTMNI